MAVLGSSLSVALAHSLAALSAFIRSAQYARVLRVRAGELARYFKKSVNFALCYAGLGIGHDLHEAWMAGEAAFLCCAYDVVTDWREFDCRARATFECVLHSRAKPDLRRLAMELYDKDRTDQLAHDGLERGAIALRFTLRMMGCDRAREVQWADIDDIGRLLQIVDDVLDIEEDVLTGDTNCLKSARRDVYLTQLILRLGSTEARAIFGQSDTILKRVIEMAHRKAQVLLKTHEPAPLRARAARAVD